MKKEKSLRQTIAREEANFTTLEQKQQKSRERLATLRAELAAITSAISNPSASATQPIADIPTTPKEKVSLFRNLFRGRSDVYPLLWVSSKTGRKGYSPACGNEWVRGICEKPRVKCSECPNQSFLPLGEKVVLDHLQGRHSIGVYPMLKDETCWFLAADFDKESWLDDVAAFVDTCQYFDIPTAVERSRSGNGAHVWFFFSSPVSAVVARRMGCYLITETMAHHHQLAMNSYDRLFPNQDTLPRGGFGNLIALPLQYEPRQAGNSAFLDSDFRPHPDQWAYLASLTRMAPSNVESIAGEASRRGKVVGVRISSGNEDEKNEAPWKLLPSRQSETKQITEPVTERVHAVLAQRLFVDIAGLPSSLLNQIKRLAAFQNPEFYKKQNMRLSTALTPRVISCAEEFSKHIALPRGCKDELVALLNHCGSKLVIDDQRNSGEPLNVRFSGKLTAIQKQAASALCKHETGVFVAPPGIGKTVIGTWLIAERQVNTLVLVHRQPLLDQWVEQLALFLELDTKDIGRIGGGKRKPNGRLDVAMIQSLVRKENVSDLVANYGHIIVDECHHLPAVSFERVLNEVKARFITGLTATPQRRDGHHPITTMQLGPIRFTIDARNQASHRSFSHNLIIRETDVKIDDDKERLVIATGRYIGEGFDDARLDTLFLALPVSWKGTLTQYAGRLHRLHPDKTEVRIYDYVDRDVPMLARMFERRLRGYRAIGYTIVSTVFDAKY